MTAKTELPLVKSKPLYKTPKSIVIYGKPKIGKSTLLSALDNCLIFDVEDGTDYLECMSVKINTLEDIKEYVEAIIAKGSPYKYIAIDTVSSLEGKICLPYAEQLYAESPVGSKWFTEGKKKYGNILNLPNGAGYNWMRIAFERLIAYISKAAPHVILVGHVKDSMLEKDGKEVNTLEIDLIGKLKRITASDADAIGYIYRKKNQNIITFKTSDEVACGSRPSHLSNQEFVISEKMEDGTVKTYWDKIYI